MASTFEEAVLVDALNGDIEAVEAKLGEMYPGEMQALADACQLIRDLIARRRTLRRYTDPTED